MANPFDIANFNLTNFAQILPDVLDSNPKTVEYTYKDANGNILTKNVENRGLFKKHLWDDVGGALGQFNRTFYVDQENGDDTNDGSSDNPLKTINAAIGKMPIGGYATLYIIGDYDFSGSVSLLNKDILISLGSSNVFTIHSFYNSSHNTCSRLNCSGYCRIGFRGRDGSNRAQIKFIADQVNDDLGWDSYIQFITKNSRATIDVYLHNCELILNSDSTHNLDFSTASDGHSTNFIHFSGYNSKIIYDPDNLYGKLINGLGAGSVVRTTNIVLEKVDGSSGDWADVISGIIRDADSGNPINLLSDHNFSS